MNKTNIKKWNSFSGDVVKSLESEINLFTQNPFNEGVDKENIIIELMLNQGFPLDSTIKNDENNGNSLWVVQHEDVPFSLVVCLDEKLDGKSEEYLVTNFEKSTLICLDDALTNKQKILLSEVMNVKTI